MPDQADAGDPIGQLEEIAQLRDREAATREILQVVSTSRDDEQLVFDAILKNAARLCEAPMAILLLVDSDGAHLIVETSQGSRPGFANKFNDTPLPLDSSIAVSARAVLEKRVIQIDDMAAGHHYAERQPHRVIAVEEEGIRSGIYVPLVHDDVGIGCIVVYRREVKPFEQSHVDLVETFAAQAVIAIENVRQFREVQNRLQREAATREVLEIISRSQDDERPVFDVILGKALHLCGAMSAGLVLGHAGGPPQRLVAHLNSHAEVIEMYDAGLIPMDPERSTAARAIVTGEVIHLKDMGDSEAYHSGIPHVRRMVDDHGVRTNLLVPLIGKEGGIGALILYKQKVAPFSDDEIALVQSFAAQAVIAIENVRQFRTIQTANHELEDRLEREAATSEILQVISQSRDDEMPVFEVILRSAARLCESPMARLHLATEDRQAFEFVASWGDDLRTMQLGERWPMSPDLVIAQTITQARSFHVENLAEHPGYLNRKQPFVQLVEEDGLRTRVTVPLVSKGIGIGSITLSRREHKPFAESDIRLVETFAAQAVIAIENVRQFRELQNRLQREAASREILDAISRSRDDDKPVFEVILRMASKLCEAPIAGLILGTTEDSQFSLAAHTGVSPEIESLFRDNPPTVDPGLNFTSKAVFSGNVIQTPDMSDTELYRSGSREIRIGVEGGIRSCLWVPLLSGSKAIGVIALYRLVVQPFTEEQIALVETFAAQAVIAIENVRQFRELQNRLAREAATREILEVISRHPDDEQPVFDAIIESAARLCDAPFAGLMLRNDADTHLVVAASKTTNSGYIEMLRENPHSLADPDALTVEAVKSMQVRQYADIEALENYELPSDQLRITWDLERMRTLLYVPLIKGDRAIGTLVLWRQEVKEFDENDIELLKIFAAQAVIAIENVRQFRELQNRLEREAATSGILSVISQSPDDESPVFEAIHQHAGRLCDAPFSGLFLIDDTGEQMDLVSHVGANPDYIREADTTWPLADSSAVVRAAVKRAVVHIEDIRETEAYRSGHTETVRAADQEGTRTFLAVPLLRQGEAIGSIGLYRREVRRFTDDEVSLVQTFAAHAVIAIENVRQFRELQTRLEREAATREILSVISQSRDDEKPVFDTILECATRLIGSPFAGMHMLDKTSGTVRMVAHVGLQAKTIEAHDFSAPIDEPVIVARAIKECAVMHRPDLTEGSLYAQRHPLRMAMVDVEGARTALVVPLVSDGAGIGCIWVFRRELRPYQEDEIALLQSFAAQAVIAIENVRQFRELQTRLEREKATGEVLGVISRSRDDELPVFDTILENAARLCQSPMSDLHLIDEAGQNSICVAHWGDPILHFEVGYQLPLDSQLLVTRSISENRCLQIADLADDDLYREGDPIRVRMVDEEGVRTFLAVPLVRDGRAIGCISMYRREIRAFSDDEISLIQTFAAQAVIAIENVRQFREVQERLQREKAMGDVLSVISKSRDDEQPVFDVIVERARVLCKADISGLILGHEGGPPQRAVAQSGVSEQMMNAYRDGHFPMDPELSAGAKAIIERRVVLMEDAANDEIYHRGGSDRQEAVLRERIRSNLHVPLISDGKGIGCLVLARMEVRPYLPEEIALVETFAAQAVIAIENVRQFRAIKTANSELEARLEREAATRKILEVISTSRDDETPVFDVIIENAKRLCEANMAAFVLGEEGGGPQVMVAHRGATEETLRLYREGNFPMDPEVSLAAQAIVSRQTLHLHDMGDTDAYRSGHPNFVSLVDQQGIRTNLLVPLVAQGRGIGCLILFRSEVRPYSDDQIALVETFAAQAVIAIQNVRQFKALEASNADLAVSLERQTATAGVLDVISQAQTDVQPVFETILQAASRLCEAPFAGLYLADESRGEARQVASLGARSEYLDRPDATWPLGNPASVPRSIAERRVIHIEDLADTDLYRTGDRERVAAVDVEGMRTYLAVPLRLGERALGCIGLYRREPRPFSDDQVALVEAFAAQAVIAIENVRQFRAIQEANQELETRLEREKASRQILSVISENRDDEKPVFDVILASACRLCEAQSAFVIVLDDSGEFVYSPAQFGARPAFAESFKEWRAPYATSPLGAVVAMRERRVVAFDDLADTASYRSGNLERVRQVDMEGVRSLVSVPLLTGDRAIGAMILYRREVRPFSDENIALVEGFAAQAVIAIENVRQFRAIQEANQELETRLEREKASRQILSVISENRDDEKPVFDVILENATRLCNAQLAFLSMANDERTHLNLEAHWGDSFPGFVAFLRDTPMPLDAGEAETARAVLEGRTIQIEDLRSGELYERGQPHRMTAIEKGGVRTLLIVPLISNGVGLGVLNLWRTEVSPFSDDEIALVEAFAAQAVIAIENVRQFRAIQAANAELQDRLKREQATGDVLSVINRSRSDQQPVFQTILESASRLCDAPLAMFGVVDEARNRMVVDAYLGASAEYIEELNKDGLPLDDPRQAAIRAITTGDPVQILDMREDDLYRAGVRSRTLSVDMEGIRTFLAVPIMAEDRGLGVIVVFRREVRAFDDDQMSLLKSFAAQAAIAIENARQFLELQTRLEREEASREILGVISESQEDEQPVFDTILRNAARLCKSPSAWLLLNDTDRKSFHAAAFWGESTKVLQLGEVWPLDRDLILTRTLLDGETLHIEDYRQTEGYLQGHPTYVRLADEEGMRTRLSVPLMLGAVPIGTIVLSRREVRPFDIEDIQLVEAFAAQAVIAIENSRQFRAIQTANSELGTRLEREEATREVLQVISRSRDDENPVFDAILKQARRLCGSPNAFLFLRNEADTHLEIVSHSGARSEFIDIMKAHPQPVDDPNSHSARAVFHNQVVHIEDLTQDQFSDTPTSQRRIAVDVEGMRTLLIVPLVAGEGAIGSILLYRREVSPFADDEIRLVQSFAAQAVIAIENVHQFRALNTRLEHEAATGEVLTVISQSREDDKPVFEIILEKAAHLCKAPHAFLQLRDATDTHLQVVAQNFRTSAFLDLLRSNPIPLHNNPGSVSVLGMNADTPTHYDDISALKGTGLYTEQLGYAIDAEGMRTALTVPLISGGRHIGVIALYKHEVSPFKQDEISLVQLFAEQAVIAIENSRQFRALQSQLQREEATSQILGVISQSRENEQAVFETILQQASRLCEAPLAVLFMGSAQDSHSTLLAHTGATPGLLEMFHNDPPPIDSELTLSGQAVHSGRTIHTLDLADTDLYRAGSHTIVTGVEKGGVRSCLWVPLISGGQAIGSIGLYRKVVRAFTDDQIALVETFAAQAVIAIENVSQLKALVEARDAAEAALADLKKAQERLIQSEKMASLGQLTAGIAHEIKNPLNFVNNFAKLSDELLAELGEILEDQIKSLDDEEREDAEDLFQTVRENLGKINQHGQRADSIIKNMLLHSREGPSERQRRALNPIVEEALNLAYHGARAENSSFNIDMQTDLAADAGEIDCYPQDLMRVFLNLISNGMYAAYKRSLSEDGFAPVISVTTRVNGDRIEVEVRDNGMGIPDDLREKIFTPFFTTKPAGEGTGLGLSLSYDIVVKQHGGDLTVDSAPGQFTVFRTTFPRTLPANVGGEA